MSELPFFFQIARIFTIFKVSSCIIYKKSPFFYTYNLQQTACPYFKKCVLESLLKTGHWIETPCICIESFCFPVHLYASYFIQHFVWLCLWTLILLIILFHCAYACYSIAFSRCDLNNLHYLIKSKVYI